MKRVVPVKVTQETLAVSTSGRGLYEVTPNVQAVVRRHGANGAGLCVVFCRHTSASVLIQENADPSVQRDLEAWFERLVPDADRLFTHTIEGPDDMPSHIRSALTASSVTIPLAHGRLLLGTWQGIYLWEHRLAPRRRELIVHVSSV